MTNILPPIRELSDPEKRAGNEFNQDYRNGGLNEVSWIIDKMQNEYIQSRVGFKPRLTRDTATANFFYSFIPFLVYLLTPFFL